MKEKLVSAAKFFGAVVLCLVVVSFLVPHAPKLIADRLPKF